MGLSDDDRIALIAVVWVGVVAMTLGLVLGYALRLAL